MKKLHSAGVIVYTKKNGETLYLLLHNTKGHWDFPKGNIESGEGKKTAALRELKEEASITATLHDGFEQEVSYVFSDRYFLKAHKKVFYFVGQAQSTNVQVSSEHDDFGWFSLNDALARVQFKDAREVLKKAGEFVEGLRFKQE